MLLHEGFERVEAYLWTAPQLIQQLVEKCQCCDVHDFMVQENSDCIEFPQLADQGRHDLIGRFERGPIFPAIQIQGGRNLLESMALDKFIPRSLENTTNPSSSNTPKVSWVHRFQGGVKAG